MSSSDNGQKNKERSLHLFVVLSRAYKTLLEHAQRDVKRHGLNLTEFGVLELLYHKGDHSLQQIGEKILLASGSITYVVDKLEEKGYLVRRPCPKDRRVMYATLTDAGRALVERIFPAHASALHEAMAGISTDEKEVAIELLKKLGHSARLKL
ncbi:transcriptional regulator, MarR family [Caldalkalibacillus thermarum TA2.A1]|uniref:MarR family transcriptional regulator n=1 Tax=Caldalkalibacillus thermarum (strain TA2.A1) TaxID=986075 RepID=F5L5I8_CALTT|nr:MarR family transcriptional regulator [Caldalkalibacillus thermarum]EGL83386.1 transcriptional regulator, MarR family [Caldalkalibacillus thermarum TA2.A1]QZT34541.1 MarR family transcriptional regulator [Caldalkalibacillus thermarum TA2.A1]